MDALLLLGVLLVLLFLGFGAYLAWQAQPTAATHRAILRDESMVYSPVR